MTLWISHAVSESVSRTTRDTHGVRASKRVVLDDQACSYVGAISGRRATVAPHAKYTVTFGNAIASYASR